MQLTYFDVALKYSCNLLLQQSAYTYKCMLNHAILGDCTNQPTVQRELATCQEWYDIKLRFVNQVCILLY